LNRTCSCTCASGEANWISGGQLDVVLYNSLSSGVWTTVHHILSCLQTGTNVLYWI